MIIYPPPPQGKTLKHAIYYRNRKTSNLFIQNKSFKDESNSHVVYRYSCDGDRCQPSHYIGYTVTTLKQRMTMHAQQGSIKDHHANIHEKKIKTAEILANTDILHRSADKSELLIAEALIIKEKCPTINNQREGENRILQIF